MAVKQFDVPGIGQVHVYKRSGVKSLRLTIRSDGTVRVTVPAWATFGAGVQFAKSRASWIAQHTSEPRLGLVEGQHIGKSHRLTFQAVAGAIKPTSRVRQIGIVISHPPKLAIDDPAVQKVATAACLKALRMQATRLLPIRLQELAATHGFSYRSVSIKNLKSRWGSCDQDTNIVLNLYLMQLPWHLIDYVLLHELTHTRIMQHGPLFWGAMQAIEPRSQLWRSEIKQCKTSLE